MAGQIRDVETAASRALKPVEELKGWKEADLYALLASRLSENSLIPSEMDFDARASIGQLPRGPSVTKLGRRIFNRWNRALYEFACKGDSEDQEIRDKLFAALMSKDVGATAMIAGTLVSLFGLYPAIAVVVASLVVKVFLKPAGEEVCEAWEGWLKRADA